MSGGEVRKVSRQDIQLVQNLIERCLQLYMNQSEVVDTLSYQAKIEPSFTELVWQKLEEENREFFQAYYIRLTLKDQIVFFNHLLESQYKLMSNKEQISASNGSNSSSVNQNGWNLATTIPDIINICNGSSSSSTNPPLIHPQQIHPLNPPLNPNPNPNSLNQTLNGSSIKSESDFNNSNSDFGFCADPGFLDPSIELTGQPLGDSGILDMDSSFGFLSQIPRNFSFSDLTEDFSQSAEILENYGRSPFLPPEANNFSDSNGEGGSRRLDTISEGVSFEDFASD